MTMRLYYDRTDERDGDKWVAKSHLLGFVFCAASKDALDDSIDQGIHFFVDSMIQAHGVPVLRKWLGDRGIEHMISDGADPHEIPERREVAELAIATAN